jgi:hypothetical protein
MGNSLLRSAADQYLSEGIVPPLRPRAGDILGVGVSALNMGTALRQTELLLGQGAQGYVCVTGVHGIMEAQSDEAFRDILMCGSGAFLGSRTHGSYTGMCRSRALL